MEKAFLNRGKFGGISGDDIFLTDGSEGFVDPSKLTGQNAQHIQFRMDSLCISTHKGDVNRSFQCMALLRKKELSLTCLNMLAKYASIYDGPHTLLSVQPSIIIDGHLSLIDLKIGPEYQRCCKPSPDKVWLSAHVFKTYSVKWDPKLFDNYLQHVDDIHDQVRDVVDLDNPFSTYGEYCCGIFATVDWYGEYKHQATRITYESSEVFLRSIIRYGFHQDMWYTRLSTLGGKMPFSYLIP
jgi:hypothetical protein